MHPLCAACFFAQHPGIKHLNHLIRAERSICMIRQACNTEQWLYSKGILIGLINFNKQTFFSSGYCAKVSPVSMKCQNTRTEGPRMGSLVRLNKDAHSWVVKMLYPTFCFYLNFMIIIFFDPAIHSSEGWSVSRRIIFWLGWINLWHSI